MRIGFIGTGKISSAVVEAICTSNLTDYDISVSPRNESKSRALERRFEQVIRSNTNQEVVDRSDMIFVALKPDIYMEVIGELSFRAEQKIVSFIPFSRYSDLKKLVKPAVDITRATPLPTVVNHVCPIQVYEPNEDVLRILGSIGQVLKVDTEKQLHTLWTLTGLISPYYDLMVELRDWAIRNDVNDVIASKYVADLFHSLAHATIEQETTDFNSLSYHAATPGGLNEWTAKKITASGANKEYTLAADQILEMFTTEDN